MCESHYHAGGCAHGFEIKSKKGGIFKFDAGPSLWAGMSQPSTNPLRQVSPFNIWRNPFFAVVNVFPPSRVRALLHGRSIIITFAGHGRGRRRCGVEVL